MKIRSFLKGVVLFACLISFAKAQESDSEPKNLSHESEASVVLVGGNSRSETYSAKQTTSYKLSKSSFTLKGHYLMGKARSQATGETSVNAENWSASLRYDYALSDSLAAFVGQGVSADRFTGVHLQTDTDVGLKATFWKATDKDYLFSEIGYRLTYFDYVEGLSPDTDLTHFARLYMEASKAISDSVYGKLWYEVLPQLDNTGRVLINFEPSLNVALSKIFSLKTGFLGKYDSEPVSATVENFDYTYTLALIAKY